VSLSMSSWAVRRGRDKFVTGGGKPRRVEIQTNGGVLGGIKGQRPAAGSSP
jgi:hypothetical protein